MTSSARDLHYGRRGGRWAEPWTDDDEARYQADLAAKHAADQARTDAPPSLFDEDGS